VTAAAGLPTAGPWVQRWLSAPRYAVYLAAAGDPERALALYEWNAQLSAAVFRDLAHVEIGLRNAYDTALSARWPGPAHWTAPQTPLFAPLYRTRGGGPTDVNARSRAALERARDDAGGLTAAPGKVVAELMFGFWRYLSSAAHEKTLWVPYLNRAFEAGTSRKDVDGAVGRLHTVRNRVAHHEHLLRTDVAARLTDCVDLTALIDPDIARHLTATTRVPQLLSSRP